MSSDFNLSPGFERTALHLSSRVPFERDEPVLEPRSLRTFVDLGLTDRQIARYFRVPEDRVVSLQRYYGLK